MEKAKKGRGRPRLADSVRRRNNITITMRDALKATLEEAAVANQRSVSAEIEHQLEVAALLRGIMPTFGRPELFNLMHFLGNVIRTVEKQTGKLWDEDPETSQEAIKAVITAMGNLRRAKTGYAPVASFESLGGLLGKVAAEDFLSLEAEGRLPAQKKQDEEQS